MPDYRFDSIYVELTSACNMECDFCTHGIMTRPRKHMEFDLFRKIIDEISDGGLTKHIRLAAIGESLLHPGVLDAIEYCARKDLHTSMITNSLILTEDLHRQLVRRGLKELYISLHNLTEESFRHRRVKTGTSFTAFYNNILKTIDFHLSQDFPNKLTIALMFCRKEWISSGLWDLEAVKEDTDNAFYLLQGFVTDLRKIALKNNILPLLDFNSPLLSLEGLDIFGGREFRIMKNVSLNIVSLNPQLFNTRKKLAEGAGDNIELQTKREGGCSSVANPMILSNGSLIPCCIDGLEELVMGKVDDHTSILSVLNGTNYQNLINGLMRGELIYPTCQECKGEWIHNGRNKFAGRVS